MRPRWPSEGIKRLDRAVLENLAIIYDDYRSITGERLQEQLASFDPKGDDDDADGSSS